MRPPARPRSSACRPALEEPRVGYTGTVDPEAAQLAILGGLVRGRIGGRYLVERVLGVGGMGLVAAARYPNIVESINVGLMALDMEDRIESWNAQMEVMYALPCWQTLTQPLKAIFPAEFVEEFNRMRQEPGIATCINSA